ncbi:MAG: aldo/keto reductase [Alphaproteobacteria bacterium]|jgi:hypothetical protein|nr:aldo/keto reductase [Alphaproteobacteria bacterium]MDP6567253.1 aldo/keto reductase [Alphaproteobacteria bacterium]MDP6811683.1 aldo/keto reductase [Alphaproteobacteria bacterium]
MTQSLDRRTFLGSVTGAGLLGEGALAAAVTDPAAPPPRIERYVTLGRTGLRVSDISFGSSSSADPDLVRHALDRGVNYFDTAESYRGGDAEAAIGEALIGVRQRVVLSSKTKAWAGDGRHGMMRALEGSLRRLRTDYLDIYFNHAVNEVARMRNPEWWEFTELARRQGKIRFRGMSGHGSQLAECLNYAVDQDLVDVVLTAYSFGQDPDFYDRLRHLFHFVALQPELPKALDRAKARDVGVIAIKTLMGARLNDMRPYESGGASFAQAAFRWVLSSPRVDALLISMTGKSLIDEYVSASREGVAPDRHDLALLARYAMRQQARYCRPGCAGCADACPRGVAIAEVLRTRMYDVDYGDRDLARADYARLGDGAAACLACRPQDCAGACPHGLPIPQFTRDAARRLS